MSASNSPFTFALASPTAATFVAPNTAAPDNCVCIAILNPSTSDDILWGIVTPSVAVGDAAVEGTNCTLLPAGQSFSIPVDVPGTVALLFAVPGAAVDVDIVYKNSLNAGY